MNKKLIIIALLTSLIVSQSAEGAWRRGRWGYRRGYWGPRIGFGFGLGYRPYGYGPYWRGYYGYPYYWGRPYWRGYRRYYW